MTPTKDKEIISKVYINPFLEVILLNMEEQISSIRAQENTANSIRTVGSVWSGSSKGI